MSQFNLPKLRRLLRTKNARTVLIVSSILGGIILAGTLVLFVFNNPITQSPSLPNSQKADLEDLPYWEEKSNNVLFDWQPEEQASPIQVSGERIAGQDASSQEVNPGFALVNEGYSMVKINQGKLSPIQGATGYQKDNRVCVLKTILSDGHEGLLQDNPKLDYELLCANLP